jgi:RNA polymerase sigma-70 factor (ECF subfamily)
MVRVAQEDEEAFRLLIERWERPVFVFLERMVGSPEEALDLSQEAFLRVYDRASRYRPSGRFRSWLFRIAGNLGRSWLRRRRILRWLRFDIQKHDRPSGAPGTDSRLEREELRLAVREALGRLPDRQRQAILLRRFEGMSQREIAATLQTTVPAVESLLQRAMTTLRRELTRKGVWQ